MATRLTVAPFFPHVDSPRAGRFDFDAALIVLIFVAQVVGCVLALGDALGTGVDTRQIVATAQAATAR
jgi:hypothetical protein